MANNRPRSREKEVTGPAASVSKRGDGLGTGPVGDTGGRPGAAQPGGNGTGGNTTRGSKKSSMFRVIALMLALVLGGGGGLTALLGGQQSSDAQAPAASQQQPAAAQTGGVSVDWTALLSGLGGGSVSTGWQSPANTGRLDTTVAPAARERYTTLLGNGKDTVTILVYMCGTDLESRSGMGTADLQEMLAARFGSNVSLLVYTGGCSGWKNEQVSSRTNQIWQVQNGRMVCLQNNLGSISMTDPDVLAGFIQWGAQNYPASRYELILWDHGGGSVSGYGYDEKFAKSGSMSLAGLDTALRTAGVKFDFIGFDACLMATAETALTMTQYADYLIASEETEPGVGWYYTDWLTALGQDTSMPTIELGQKIVDSFVDTCAEKCRGQLTTLSVTDLAELEATLPSALAAFSRSTSQLIRDEQYTTVSSARSGAREFAQSSRIDQVDLVHLARNLGTPEGQALAEALLGAVKYNRTSDNMTNAWGISVYFPYRRSSNVDQAASTFNAIGMDKSYIQCIRQFASLEVSGQAAAGGTGSPLTSLLGELGGGSGSGAGDIASLLGELLGGSFGRIAGLDDSNTDFLSDRALDEDALTGYLAGHRFPAEDLVWQTGTDDVPVLRLDEDAWRMTAALELNLFYDDGEGYIDLGLDNVFEFDDEGGLLGVNDGSWLGINGQPVAYYHTATMDDGVNYSITGRVPVLHNGERAELILVFDNEDPHGRVAGVQTVYHDGETETVAKSGTELQPGDTIEFLCDYYGYDGTYQDSYLLGEALTVGEEALVVSDLPLEGSTRATYRFTDLYGNYFWTETLPEA